MIGLAIDFIKVEERNISKEELYGAKEIFMCSTTKRILPIIKVDEIKIGNEYPGEITTDLYKRFLSLEEVNY